MKSDFLTVLLLIALLATGCKDNTSSETTTSNVAQLTAFSLGAQDDYPGLAAATFRIDERLDTGLVQMVDSLLYGTRLDSVKPNFTFKTTPGSARWTNCDTTFLLSGSDILDLEKRPIYLTIKSSDGTTTKVYEINVWAHQADPDLWNWTNLNEQAYATDDCEQQTLRLGEHWVTLKNNGLKTTLYTSADGAAWQPNSQAVNLPASAHVRSIVSDGETLYYAQDNILYTSTDGIAWNMTDHTDRGLQIENMLMCWNEHVWAIVETDGHAELAWLDNGWITPMGLCPKSDFPVSDFATVQFESSSERARALAMGGYSKDGRALHTRWSIEYAPSIQQNHGYRMIDLSIDHPKFTEITGVSIVWYNHMLYMFGGVDSEGKYNGSDILYSVDEGLNWIATDTTKNQLPEGYGARQKQSARVHNNSIYLFGGQDEQGNHSDVYRGRLNSIDWE